MTDWARGLRAAGRARASRCGSAHEEGRLPPPRVAFCIAGSARGFATPLVHEMLRTNLVSSLASLAPGAGRERRQGSRAFVLLKTADSSKLSRWGNGDVNFEAHSELASQLPALGAALEQRWLRRMLAEAVLLNGSGSFSGEGWRPPPMATVGAGRIGMPPVWPHPATRQPEPDEEGWRRYRSRECGMVIDRSHRAHPSAQPSAPALLEAPS